MFCWTPPSQSKVRRLPIPTSQLQFTRWLITISLQSWMCSTKAPTRWVLNKQLEIRSIWTPTGRLPIITMRVAVLDYLKIRYQTNRSPLQPRQFLWLKNKIIKETLSLIASSRMSPPIYSRTSKWIVILNQEFSTQISPLFWRKRKKFLSARISSTTTQQFWCSRSRARSCCRWTSARRITRRMRTISWWTWLSKPSTRMSRLRISQEWRKTKNCQNSRKHPRSPNSRMPPPIIKLTTLCVPLKNPRIRPKNQIKFTLLAK